LPGGQIYENLVSGSIDATEWVGPWNDYFLKFYEATKYYYTGGMHEPGGDAAAEVFDETRQHSDLAARVNDSYQSALRDIGGFRAIAEIEFSQQRNRVLGLT
jgi:TRAP-type mannitol/chloroaromatic compound transport system substrate-binding protein